MKETEEPAEPTAPAPLTPPSDNESNGHCGATELLTQATTRLREVKLDLDLSLDNQQQLK